MCASQLFGSCLNAQQHLALHDEVGRFKDNSPQKEVEDWVLQVRVIVTLRPDNQTRRFLINWLKNECPPTLEYDRTARFDRSHFFRRGLGMKPHLVSDLEFLPLRDNFVSILHVAADQILEPGVAVEPATCLTHLDEPRPNINCWSINSDCVSRPQFGTWCQFIAYQVLIHLFIGCAPTQMPWTDTESVSGHCACAGHC